MLSAPSYNFPNIASVGRGRGERGMPPLLHQGQGVGVMAQLGACVSDGAHGKGSVHQNKLKINPCRAKCSAQGPGTGCEA